ncbi:MAG: AbrB/MazE/SpoVT family DNA-binding domain-containing protein [Euryarchaeota archaeon]|nr:AbrB/MazE/SpoVT family DNA-binding domain-containing protein [Euryarchaeota archaeon]
METVSVSKKYQIVVPKKVREALGIEKKRHLTF